VELIKDVTLTIADLSGPRFGEEFAEMRQPGRSAPRRENRGFGASTNPY
jgi:hypothetical protein